jgi:tetratricopeptide (TPR) repeat protein
MRLTRLDLGIAALLIAGCVIAFGPALRADFIGFDDPVYVSRNRHVLGGLTSENVRWAWTKSFYYASNWHPLTWMSLQLDAGLWKASNGWPEAWGFHLTNVVLHAANAVVLLLALQSLMGPRWRSATVAALFAFHPLRVESVAWVSERKDVLSIFFGLLALVAYARYVRRPTLGPYILVAALFALSLLSKPTLVTLPMLLLVLDWWPLGRIKRAGDWRWLVLEKLPLLMFTLASCVITFGAQACGGSVRPLETLGVGERIAGAVVAYATYLGMIAWPANLAPIYPYPPSGWSAWRVGLSTLVLAGATVFVVRQRRERPFLLAGWLWYLGTLVPVIGLVQVGNQAYADRYTYFPFIGICVAVAWSVPASLPLARTRRAGVLVTAVTVLLAALTWRQTTFWQSDLDLWPHTIEATGPNAHAYNSLGTALETRDRNAKEAIKYYDAAVNANPGYGTAWYNLGRALRAQGDTGGAVARFREALRTDPLLADAHNDLAVLLSQNGAPREAEQHFRDALRLRPEDATFHRNLGWLLSRQGGRELEAMEEYAEAIRLSPDDGEAHGLFGVLLGRRGDLSQSLPHLRRAAELQPVSASAQMNLGIALEKMKRDKEAAVCFRRVTELSPKDVRGRMRLAGVMLRLGDTAGATEQYRRASEIDPEWPQEVIATAWALATAPDAARRDAEVAVWAAESACYATHAPPPSFLDTLAAAYAESGRFADAVAVAEKAKAAAESAGRAELAAAIAGRLALYRKNRPFHEAVPAPR